MSTSNFSKASFVPLKEVKALEHEDKSDNNQNTEQNHATEWRPEEEDLEGEHHKNCFHRALEFIEKTFSQFLDDYRKFIRWIIMIIVAFLCAVYLVAALALDFQRAMPILILTVLVGGYFLAKYGFIRWGPGIITKTKSISISKQRKEIYRSLMYFGLLVVLVVIAAVTRVFHSLVGEPRRVISIMGLFTMLFISLLFSKNPTKIRWRTIFWGLYLQMLFGLLILRTKPGFIVFSWLGEEIEHFLNYSSVGAEFVFGPAPLRLHSFLFIILPVIIFTSAMFNLLYYLGLMQVIIRGFSFVMHHTMGVSGAESFGAASNIFVGCSTAPLAIKPYLADFTQSEMNSLMVSGLSTIAGSVLAVYISFGISAAHLLSASIMSAPAALVVAKIFVPEVGKPVTAKHASIENAGPKAKNFFEALYTGATDGLKICGYILANILTIISLLALINAILLWLGEMIEIQGLSFELICKYTLYPIAWVLGTDPDDCFKVAELIGIKTFLNEFLAYEKLAEYIKLGTLTKRSEIIVTYAICGFSHIGSIGVLLGGLAPLVPNRLPEISSMCIRALIAACIACFMTASVAGFLYDKEQTFLGGDPEVITAAAPLLTVM